MSQDDRSDGMPPGSRSRARGNGAEAPGAGARRPSYGTPTADGGLREERPSREQQRDARARQRAAVETMAAAIPANAAKVAEYVLDDELPWVAPGRTADAPPAALASTLSERNANDKTGGPPRPGADATPLPLAAHRVDDSGAMLRSRQGVPIADNQNSLKAGAHGPVLLEDFLLREKLAHFDRERIAERVVFARGAGAHGWFECTHDITRFTRAAPFAQVGKRTPVFTRFSNLTGERGSADTVRDLRGFAVKFYTEDGNWDLVGGTFPVTFVQDALKFPDFVHALKPEPHHQMPQASSAHDTLWDFVSLMPEALHALLWLMSDRALPRSLRMMQGFGVHTFRLVNADGAAELVKFHWTPVAGTHALCDDEAIRLAGADPDFLRRDLWEAIENGAFPEYLLQLQVFDEVQADGFPFDVLDPTKLVPEELVPLQTVGRLVLDRNPDNFFAETEQAAFATHHVIPGIDFTNDPVLQGRNFAYLDAQLARLGGPNYHALPINAPLVPAHHTLRDGLHQHAVHRGRAHYEPNSLGGGCPFQAGEGGFGSYRERLVRRTRDAEPIKLRVKPEKFADHVSQARLFWASQSTAERAHLARALRSQLARVETRAVRSRVLALLRHVDDGLAQWVADGLALPLPIPLPGVGPAAGPGEPARSPGLSLAARPGRGTLECRRVALLVAADAHPPQVLVDELRQAGALPCAVRSRLVAESADDAPAAVEQATFETAPSVLFDAVVLPATADACAELATDGLALEFIALQYRHGKPMLAPYAANGLLALAGVPVAADEAASRDAGLILVGDDALGAATPRLIAALARHRVWERQRDPPVA